MEPVEPVTVAELLELVAVGVDQWLAAVPDGLCLAPVLLLLEAPSERGCS